MFESSSVEFEEKKEPKRVALSVGEMAIVSSERKSEGMVEGQKLVEILLAKDQKDLLVKEDEMRGFQFSIFHSHPRHFWATSICLEMETLKP